ncbi:hypothetical protein Golomagni_06769 [Golovinomyces magnicellulatus]|nr:hypothetical protein Golomagni_06769 [Golovinomyces magnicellulatus]
MPQESTTETEFSALYLQRVTKEVAEDIDKVRTADDFKSDSIPFLVHALQQGANQFSSGDKKRVVQSSQATQSDSSAEER